MADFSRLRRFSILFFPIYDPVLHDSAGRAGQPMTFGLSIPTSATCPSVLHLAMLPMGPPVIVVNNWCSIHPHGCMYALIHTDIHKM